MGTTKNPVKLKSGGQIPAGAIVNWSKGKATITWVSEDGVVQESRLSARGAARALGIEEPSYTQLEAWVLDSVCDSVLGEQVEPDGYDPAGSPSWLLAFGMI